MRYFGVILVIAVSACIEPYPPPIDDSSLDILVVDGFLDMTDQIATVNLAFATPLSSSSDVNTRVADAEVDVQTADGISYPLKSVAPGKYSSSMPLTTETRYSLHIRRSDGREYSSDEITLRRAPAIDSVTWKFNGTDILFYLYAHDETNTAKYYRWDFNETYEYTASFESDFKLSKGTWALRDRSEYTYICYRTDTSTVINVGTTEHLSGSQVNGLLLYNLGGESVKVSRRYSMDLRQTAVSQEEYEYWRVVKKQNESLGGLFDPQPTQVYGNIHRVGESEPVIGYFSGGEVAHKRVLFDFYTLNADILNLRRTHPCDGSTTLQFNVEDLGKVPRGYEIAGAIHDFYTYAIVAFVVAPLRCVDCKKQGGTTIPPSYWPKDRL